jgi:nitrite reductase/ring-hydroxylating ferredoxin subunit
MDDPPTTSFVRVGRLEELKARGRLVVRGPHRPILVVYDHGRIFALDNRCPHMGFPLERGSVEDGILTCHWHHARFDLASGCTFDLWADDVPSCPVEVRGSEIWVQPTFGHAVGSMTAWPTISAWSSPRRCMVNSPPTCPRRTSSGRSRCTGP